MSSAVNTVIVAGASTSFCSVREAVTTMTSSMVVAGSSPAGGSVAGGEATSCAMASGAGQQQGEGERNPRASPSHVASLSKRTVSAVRGTLCLGPSANATRRSV
jgi:hypothetical protein